MGREVWPGARCEGALLRGLLQFAAAAQHRRWVATAATEPRSSIRKEEAFVFPWHIPRIILFSSLKDQALYVGLVKAFFFFFLFFRKKEMECKFEGKVLHC